MHKYHFKIKFASHTKKETTDKVASQRETMRLFIDSHLLSYKTPQRLVIWDSLIISLLLVLPIQILIKIYFGGSAELHSKKEINKIQICKTIKMRVAIMPFENWFSLLHQIIFGTSQQRQDFSEKAILAKYYRFANTQDFFWRSLFSCQI